MDKLLLSKTLWPDSFVHAKKQKECEEKMVNYSEMKTKSQDDEDLSLSIRRNRKKLENTKKLFCDVKEQEIRRVTANMMERNRMKNMNEALNCLRDKLPDEFKLRNKRMSKIRTLRVAINYIRSMRELLDMDDRLRQEQMTWKQTHHQSYQTIKTHWSYTACPMFLHIQESPKPDYSMLKVGSSRGHSGTPTPRPCFPYVISPSVPLTPAKRRIQTPEYDHGTNQRSSFGSRKMPTKYPESNCTPLNLATKYPHFWQNRDQAEICTLNSPHQSPFFSRNLHELNTSFQSTTSDEASDITNPQVELAMECVFKIADDAETETKQRSHQSFYS